ncbi:MAG: peptidase [Negativicutes bacterium]|nr:peptidase [Negativicutes bacterium]
MAAYLGIDTSCYTTSLALIDDQERIVADCRRMLSVERGQRGLSQSAMLFQHMKNLPLLWEEAAGRLDGEQPVAVAATAWPRRESGSYMPAFLMGTAMARLIATTTKAGLWFLSHQEAHVWSALLFCPELLNNPGGFGVLHLSGGTCELLQVSLNEKHLIVCRKISASADITPGQMIDRIGVRLGMEFPCGRQIDRLAATVPAEQKPVFAQKPALDGQTSRQISFSGSLSAVERLIDSMRPLPDETVAIVCRDVLVYIADSILVWLDAAGRSNGAEEGSVPTITDVLLCGGVASSDFLRSQLMSRAARNDWRFYWAKPHLSTDNAVGAAMFARRVACAATDNVLLSAGRSR